MGTGTLKELFPTGKQLEPTVTRLADDRLALGRDDMTIFIDSEGNPTQKVALYWNENPTVMGELWQLYTIMSEILDKYECITCIIRRLLDVIFPCRQQCEGWCYGIST